MRGREGRGSAPRGRGEVLHGRVGVVECARVGGVAARARAASGRQQAGGGDEDEATTTTTTTTTTLSPDQSSHGPLPPGPSALLGPVLGVDPRPRTRRPSSSSLRQARTRARHGPRHRLLPGQPAPSLVLDPTALAPAPGRPDRRGLRPLPQLRQALGPQGPLLARRRTHPPPRPVQRPHRRPPRLVLGRHAPRRPRHGRVPARRLLARPQRHPHHLQVRPRPWLPPSPRSRARWLTRPLEPLAATGAARSPRAATSSPPSSTATARAPSRSSASTTATSASSTTCAQRSTSGEPARSRTSSRTSA